jgi:hypothetical protein
MRRGWRPRWAAWSEHTSQANSQPTSLRSGRTTPPRRSSAPRRVSSWKPWSAKPNVDDYLNNKVEQTTLPDGLRICGARIGRSIYTLRNKRNIAHKGVVDPNTFDLAYIHQGAAWIMAELIRSATGISLQEAGALIELVHAPVGTLVEDIDSTRLVHADVSVRVELLILLLT